MNILGDFINRVNSLYPESIDNDELDALLTTIKNQGDEIEKKDKAITRLQAKIDKMQKEEDKLKARIEKMNSEKETKKPAARTTKKKAE